MSSNYYGGIAGEEADSGGNPYPDDADYREEGEPDDWYDDRDDYREPDPEDGDIARAYEEYYEHCDKAHGGGECNCRPSPWSVLARRLWNAAGWFPHTYWRARYALREPWTLRLGPAEITVRLNRHRPCGACSARGWFYSKGTANPVPIPPGYDGVSLCGCGSAIGKLADSRRAVRRFRKEAPF